MAGKRGRKPGIPTGSGGPVEPQVTEDLPPEQEEVEDQEAEEGSQSEEAERDGEQSEEEHEPEDPEGHGPEDEGHEPEDHGAEVIKSKKRKSDRIKPAQQQGEPSASKAKRIRREWAPSDEIMILKEIVNYRHTHGHPPEIKDNGFFESVIKQLGDQSLELRSVKDKMCSLRRRFFENKHKSTTEHGKCLDNLSNDAWGKPSQVGAKDSSDSILSKKAVRKHSRVGAEDSNGSKTGGKSFEEMCEMYPLLAQEVELIADVDPSAKSSFTRIYDEVACKLEKELDAVKVEVSQVRQTLATVLAEAC